MPLRFLYGVFVYFTWTAKPLVNLLLRLDPLGRAVLTPQQLRMTNAVAACVGITVLALAEALIFQEPIGLITALLSALMLIPVSGLFSARDERIRQGVGIYCTVMAAVAVFVTVTLALDIEALWGPALMIFVYMLAAYVWLGNLILSRERRE